MTIICFYIFGNVFIHERLVSRVCANNRRAGDKQKSSVLRDRVKKFMPLFLYIRELCVLKKRRARDKQNTAECVDKEKLNSATYLY